jgi:magnesium chelatase family protein
MQLVGLPDAAVRESRERVRSAVKNCGFELPPRAVVINLAPADIKKEGNHLDLPIALALLVAHGHLPEQALDGKLVCGELGLSGALRPIRGSLAIADLACRLGIEEVVLPAANAAEAAALEALPIRGASGLAETVEHLLGTRPLLREIRTSSRLQEPNVAPDLAEVKGQASAKRALEIAAAGGHNLLLIGPPGSGKTMLARRMPGLLPELTPDEAIEVTKIHSLVTDRPNQGLVRERPFRSPHPSTSTAGMVGGGSVPRPGEATLAHAGVLFLDEFPEFRRDSLEALRQPLEEGAITIVRARARISFPARFTLLAAMNPCPCGHLGDPRHECECVPAAVQRYRQKVSGPLLDRIDLHVEVPAVSLEELKGVSGESTHDVASRVRAARAVQRQRWERLDLNTWNADMSSNQVHESCKLDPEAQRLLDRAFEKLGLSARAVHRVLKVSRTLADLGGDSNIRTQHLAEAIQYRSLDRRLEA